MDFEVVIVGAGPSGLSLAIELGRRSISCLVIEQNDRVGYAPRAKTTHVRTCEHLRRWGIADALRAAAPFGVNYPPDALFATRLNGHLLAKIENLFCCSSERNDLYSEHAQWIPQYKLEAVLKGHAESLACVQFCFGVRLESAFQDKDGVSAVLRHLPDGQIHNLRTRFLVGADGAASTVRKLLGIEMRGTSPLSHNNLVIFRARGLARKIGLPPGIMYWIVNTNAPAGLTPMDMDDIWSFGSRTQMANNDDARAVINLAAGFEVDAEIMSMERWTAHALIADRYRDARIFLIGDACHLHPPFGGFGMNMGFGDGVDLGWKIAAFLQGWGGPAILDSYEIERRPVHLRVINEAVINHKVTSTDLAVPGIEGNDPAGERIRSEVGDRIFHTKLREFRTLGVVLGSRYSTSPIIIDDGTAPPTEHFSDYVPNAVPGSRAPHAWLSVGTAYGASLFDHFGNGFTLLVTDRSAEPSACLFVRIAAELSIPLTVLFADSQEIFGLYRARLTLIRPDQHIAWRGDTVTDISAVLKVISGHSDARYP